MTRQEFMTWLEAEFTKHPMLARSNPRSLNELCYVLRMSGEDFNISVYAKDGRATCIPSVCETFIPSRQLALKIKVVDFEEEYVGGKTYSCISVEVLDDDID